VNRYALDVSFSSQNCNSLNVSTSVRNQAAKIVSILDLGTDIIFLSDTRLNGRHKSIVDAFRAKYRMYYHSSTNWRGVAVLIRNDLDIQVLDDMRDTQENALLLRVTIRDEQLIIGSVYGPNTNEFALFEFLQDRLRGWIGVPVILGGDWNATLSNLPLNVNPDVFSMRAVPSTARTNRILQLCDEFSLADPYRSLHPEERDYTYIPSGVLRTNRSRIDYFLVSDVLFENISKCEIAQAFCKKSFDHKHITLSFKKAKKTGRKCINNRLLENPLLDWAIKLAIWFCFLSEITTVPGGIVEAVVQDECLKLNDIDLLFNEAVFLQGKARVVGISVDEEERRTILARQLDESWTRILPYAALQQYPRQCDDDLFFERLIESTSNAAFKLQQLVSIAENSERKNLLENLRVLKRGNGYVANFQEIQEIESKLNAIEERTNADKVVNYLKTDILDNEKITPHFLRIAKTVSNDSLEKIRKDDGTVFPSKNEQEAHIVKFYKDLYSLPEDMPDDFSNCVEDFLGPEICQHPVVTNSKLNEEEKNNLESPLNISELDESVTKLNLRSAPGIDGVSNRFIAKYWQFFREPLHRYATKCIENGRLTETFRTAIIRLIPKKGNTTQLKNWRPISLLSCYYKIISKALNARLGKVIGKVTSLAQKAYSPDRYMHEAIINTVETIMHCQREDTSGILLSVDLHKAFDSVYHEFMREVYRFFGFGDYFIRLSETLGNGRCAHIIFDSGKYSDQIELARCCPQGDSPSPRQFNMCQQICIFKIELDPAVQSVYLSFIVPRPIDGVLVRNEELAPQGDINQAEARGYRISPELRTTKKRSVVLRMTCRPR